MQVVINIVGSLFLFFCFVWTLLPWGFGVHNYAKSHGKLLVFVARASWLVLLLVHPLLIYLVWFESISYWLMLALIIAHIVFCVLFARDVSTR